jgi:hypothetical protein
LKKTFAEGDGLLDVGELPDDEAEGGPRVPHSRQQVDPLRGHPSQLTLICVNIDLHINN